MPLPDWFESTPNEQSYNLTMYDGGGGSIQDIELSRAEFEALKFQLGGIRSFEYADHLKDLRGSHEDVQQGAFFIDNARLYIKRYSALVFA